MTDQPGNGDSQYQGQYQPTAEMLEDENARLEESLKGKVQALKSVSRYSLVLFTLSTAQMTVVTANSEHAFVSYKMRGSSIH